MRGRDREGEIERKRKWEGGRERWGDSEGEIEGMGRKSTEIYERIKRNEGGMWDSIEVNARKIHYPLRSTIHVIIDQRCFWQAIITMMNYRILNILPLFSISL